MVGGLDGKASNCSWIERVAIRDSKVKCFLEDGCVHE